MKPNAIKNFLTANYFRENKQKISFIISIALFLFSVFYPSIVNNGLIWPQTNELILAVLLSILPFFFEFYLTTANEIKWAYMLEKVFLLHPSRRDLLNNLIKEHLKNEDEKLINKFALNKVKEKYDEFTNEVILNSICNHHLTFYNSQARYTDLELVSGSWNELKAITFLENKGKCELKRYKRTYLEAQGKQLQNDPTLKITRIYILCEDLIENGILIPEANERLQAEKDHNIDVYWIANDDQLEASEINDILIVDHNLISISDLTSGDIDKIYLSWNTHVINKHIKTFDKLLGESQQF